MNWPLPVLFLVVEGQTSTGERPVQGAVDVRVSLLQTEDPLAVVADQTVDTGQLREGRSVCLGITQWPGVTGGGQGDHDDVRLYLSQCLVVQVVPFITLGEKVLEDHVADLADQVLDHRDGLGCSMSRVMLI